MTPTPRFRPLPERALAFAPVVLMVSAVVLTIPLFRRAEEGRQLVRLTEAVLTSAAAAFSHLQDAETGQRGYLITGQEAYLEPHHRGRDSVTMDLAHLKRLTRDNPAQQRVLEALSVVTERKLALIDTTISLRRAGHADSAVARVRSGIGRQLMDSARVLFGQLTREERSLLDARARRERNDQDTARYALLLGVALAALTSFLVSSRLAGVAESEAEASRVLRTRTEELIRTTQALSQANAAKGMFLANMSHELRTPLNAIAGHVQLIDMGIHGPVTREQRATLDRIARAQRHLLALINDVLNFAKLDARRVTYAMSDTDISAVLKDVIAMVGPQMATAGLTLSTSTADETVHVAADPEKLRQILINLFSNATKFTPGGGTVTFGVRESPVDAEMVELSVTDTGIGIPAGQRDEIFDPFVQLAPVTTAVHHGAGLGLAISRELARGMGGDLTLESVVGAGSTFTLTLHGAQRTA